MDKTSKKAAAAMDNIGKPTLSRVSLINPNEQPNHTKSSDVNKESSRVLFVNSATVVNASPSFYIGRNEARFGRRTLEIRREPLMLNVWSQTTYLKKAEIKKALVWVKFHHVPIVAYSKVGLSLISTQVGKAITFDLYTSNMCVSWWGRSTYARVLIEVSAKNELKDELVVAIPVGKDMGHTLATISIKYEWKPPRCSTCLVFAHTSDKCPTLPKETPAAPSENDGFQVVKKKKNKNKNKQVKQVEGAILNKLSLNLRYRKVDKSSKKYDSKTTNEPTGSTRSADKSNILVSNSFNVLENEEEDTLGDTVLSSTINESDSEDVDEELLVARDGKVTSNVPGASTPVNEEIPNISARDTKATVMEEKDDGFKEVKSRKKKKGADSRSFGGLRLNKPNSKVIWQQKKSLTMANPFDVLNGNGDDMGKSKTQPKVSDRVNSVLNKIKDASKHSSSNSGYGDGNKDMNVRSPPMSKKWDVINESDTTDDEAGFTSFSTSVGGGNQLEDEDSDFYGGYEDQVVDLHGALKEYRDFMLNMSRKI
nr:hypothetical protein [Tanacetum cinerariifolium]